MLHVTQQLFDGLKILYDNQGFGQAVISGAAGSRPTIGTSRAAQAQMTPAEANYGGLEPGDILFHSDSNWTKFSRTHRFRTMHCSIMVDRLNRAHAVPTRGIIKSNISQFKEPGLVFRIKHYAKSYAAEAARQAIHMLSGSAKVDELGNYSRNRLFKALPGLKGFGSGAAARLDKYKDSQHNHNAKNVTCAEFVILCYQLVMEDSQPTFIRLDAKNTLPWNLEDYFLHNYPEWDLVGRIRGSQCFTGGEHY